jgi:hypothetical protein
MKLEKTSTSTINVYKAPNLKITTTHKDEFRVLTWRVMVQATDNRSGYFLIKDERLNRGYESESQALLVAKNIASDLCAMNCGRVSHKQFACGEVGIMG